MDRFRVDLHTHTRHSRDAALEPAELVARARAAGLHRIAVTDHNRMDGAWQAKQLDPELVIVGEEVDCRCGAHLIGLFLSEPIPPGLPVAEVAARIRAQGGIVYAPHPFAYLRDPAGRAQRVLEVADVVEVHNARAAFAPPWNRRAAHAAAGAGLPCAAGTDCHFAGEVGGAFTELPPFHDAVGLRAALREAVPVPVRTPLPHVHVASVGVHLFRHATGRLR